MPNCPYCGQECENRRGLKSHSTQTHSRPPFSKDDLGDFLTDLADEVGGKPAIRDLAGTKYTQNDVLHLFDTWNEALEYAGITPRPSREPGPGAGKSSNIDENRAKDRVVSEIQSFYEENGQPPTWRAYDDYTETHGAEFVRKRLFDSWNAALRYAGVGINSGAVDNREGENNPTYIDGSSKSARYGSNWNEQRKRVLERDGYECRSCGMNQEQHKEEHGKSLEVHHIVPLRRFDDPVDANSLGNLVTACVPCHRRFEGLPVFPE